MAPDPDQLTINVDPHHWFAEAWREGNPDLAAHPLGPGEKGPGAGQGESRKGRVSYNSLCPSLSLSMLGSNSMDLELARENLGKVEIYCLSCFYNSLCPSLTLTILGFISLELEMAREIPEKVGIYFFNQQSCFYYLLCP